MLCCFFYYVCNSPFLSFALHILSKHLEIQELACLVHQAVSMLRGDWPCILQVIEHFDLLEIQGIAPINPVVS